MDDQLRQRLRNRDERFVEDAFARDQCRHFFAVDWREDDTDIIAYCADCIELDSLSAEWHDDTRVIIRNGKETIVP